MIDNLSPTYKAEASTVLFIRRSCRVRASNSERLNMNIYQTNVGNYGSYSTIHFAQTARRIVNVKNVAKHNPHEVVDKHNVRRTITEPKVTAGVDRLWIVGTQNDYYIVRMPDRTYGKVDIKTEKFLGAY